MPISTRPLARLVVAAAIAAPVFSLGAQGAAAPSCPVETMAPQPISIAYLQRNKVVGAKTPDEATKAIRDGMKQLFDDKAKANATGRDYLLAQFYLLAIEYGGDTQTRGNLGLPGDKLANVDLVTGADSLLQIVEKAEPKCAAEIAQWREFKPYLGLVQGAYKAFAAGAVDSAQRLATRALILSKSGPQPYDILWRVAQKKGDEAGQLSNLRTAIDKLAGDTNNIPVRANFVYTLGRIQQEMAEKRPDKAAKAATMREAIKAYMDLLKEYPTSDEAPFALQSIAMGGIAIGDTASAVAVVELLKSAPARFGDGTLAQAGVLATRLSRSADAAFLFGEAAKQNPYSRDYQYNLAAMLYESKKKQEMLPVVRKLVALDPSNPDNILLFAYYYKTLSDVPEARVKAIQADSAKTFAKADLAGKKAVRDSLAFYRAAQKVWVDSVAVYGELADKMPHRVAYTEFERGKEKTVLKGNVENHGKAARTFTIEFEFLGKDGAVVGKKAAVVENVAAGGTGDFTVELPIGGVLGVRYAPLPLK